MDKILCLCTLFSKIEKISFFYSCCIGFLLESENQFEGWCELAMELARPSYGVRSDYPLFSITEGASWDHLLQGAGSNSESTNEVLRHVQQLDSIDEAGIDANHMICHH